ncbi:hypothetical protein BJEO58_02002 [Brevibacterium jeotgali]|uniref:Phosphodiesterase n=2 Tax=Brevibacterium jeotgali TaxID=1262550 RepID=A0A2H1L666_9MICO|nr:hypothetical protein FB108_2317 [Brevibacterium jeotgali]SMY12408.1 hypothetical protein BJEO58_02002 [Brevibacterium jeotgali]
MSGAYAGRMAIPHELISDLQAAGYYPQLAGTMLVESLFDEEIRSHFVHIDTHVDLDSIHRHVTAFAITPTRLLIAHVDDDPAPRPLGQPPRAMTSSEAIELDGIRTVLIGRTYERPAQFEPGQAPVEVSLTLGWGSTTRIDTFPEACTDPQCDADHGYGGSLLSEDLTLRVSAQAEGPDAVARAQAFAVELRRASFRATRDRG